MYSMVKESTFLKGNFCIYKFLWTFSAFWPRRKKKKQTKCAPIWNWFYVDFLMSLANLICVNGSPDDPVSVTLIAFKG